MRTRNTLKGTKIRGKVAKMVLPKRERGLGLGCKEAVALCWWESEIKKRVYQVHSYGKLTIVKKF